MSENAFDATEGWLLAPTLDDEFELLAELGRGGMAVVYRARHRRLGREVAVKVVRAKYAEDAEAVARFEREARTVVQLEHPNIVRTFAVRQYRNGSLAIVMQHVHGETLRQSLRQRPQLPFETVELVLGDVACALAHAHGRGIVHRDVKPENVFLEEGIRRALLSDFGVARSIDADRQLTLTGTTIGTPAYMSPEQIDGAPVDGRSDIYSLGLVGWEMLAGRRPWQGETVYQVLYRQKHEQLPRLAELRPETPPHLLRAIEVAVEKERAARWSTAEEFLEQLTGGRILPSPVEPARAARAEIPARVTDGRQSSRAAGPRRVSGRTHRRRRVGPAVLPVVAVAAAVLVFGAVLRGRRAPRPNPAVASRTVTPPADAPDSVVRSAQGGMLAPPPADTSPASPAAATTRADSLQLCESPAPSDQRACFLANLAEGDVALNRVYGDLIRAMRRRAGASPGAGDPAEVRQLRSEQRAWLRYRETECRRLTRGEGGARWAPPRARCIRGLSDRRTAELAAALDRLKKS